MAKNTIIMIGDGMGWEMTRAAAIYKQIQEGKTGASLSDFYTAGKGTGLNMQTLTGYTIATTYATTVPVPVLGADGKYTAGNVYSNGQAAILGNTAVGTTVTNQTYPDLPGFSFNPTFNPGTTATGGAKVSDGVVGNLVGYDPVKGGAAPWLTGTDSGYIKNSYPDSANTATTLYTGVKTYNGAVGVDIFENPLQGVLAKAAEKGKSTGLVTSVPIDHATPGAAAANVNNRNKYDGPTLDYILQQELRTYQPTVLLGGGHPLSATGNPLPVGVEPNTDNTYITPATYAKLTANPTGNEYGYTFLERGTDAATKLATAAAALDPTKGGRLLGLYGARGQNGNLPVSSANGDYSTTGLDIFSLNTTKGLKQDTLRPLKAGETDAQFITTERNQNPTLDDLTKAALTVLGKDPDGMWLMVEGGDIDWAAHDNNMDNLIGATLDFDKAVGSVIDWIGKNGGWAENEIIVTADHDHYLTLNGDFPTLVSNSKDVNGINTLTSDNTIAGSGQEWGNSTTDKYDWGNHSNRPVPVYYQGAGTELLTASIGQGYTSYGTSVQGVAGAIDQSHIAQTMFNSVNQSAPTAFSGVAAGDATAYDAMLWTRTFNPVTNKAANPKLTAQVSTDASFSNIAFSYKVPANTDGLDRDGTVKVDATGLQSGTKYYYRFKTDAGETSLTGTFKTAPGNNTSAAVKFGFSGDYDGVMRPYASTANFGKLNLDFFGNIGDTIYETASTGSPAAADPNVNATQALTDYHRKYLENIQPVNPGGFASLQTFFAAQGNYTALDNHELGNKQLINGGAPSLLAANPGNGTNNTTYDVNKTGTFINQTTPFKTLVQAYTDYQPIKAKTVVAPNDPRSNGTQQLYNAQQWGQNMVYINTDTRSYRDVRLKTTDAAGNITTTDDTGARADNADRTMLGKTQLAWLKQNLLEAQQNGTAWKFVAVSDPIDQLGAIGSGADGGKSWIGGYRAERNDLLKFIADNGIKNVVFLSCDDHQNRVNELTYLDNINDPKSVKTVPNALSIVDGPVGATGPDTITDHSFANLKSLADKLAATQTAAGINPIGLSADFAGLKNVVREGDPNADKLRQPIDFYSPDTFNYTTFDISADGKTLNVNVQGINSSAANTFPEPSATNPVRSILSFSLDAAPVQASTAKYVDLRDLPGKAKCDVSVTSDAAYNNYGGFYTIDDRSGKIGTLNPGDAGYAAAAIKRAVTNNYKTEPNGTSQIDGGKLLAPYLIANGTVTDFLTKNATNAGGANEVHAYFNYLGANPDKLQHMKSLANNGFACEDLFGGGDLDFNDYIIQANFKPV